MQSRVCPMFDKMPKRTSISFGLPGVAFADWILARPIVFLALLLTFQTHSRVLVCNKAYTIFYFSHQAVYWYLSSKASKFQ
jgi:hypothetical protein